MSHRSDAGSTWPVVVAAPYPVFAIICDGHLVTDYQISAQGFTTLVKPFLQSRTDR
jgi:hypothetical protein